MKHKTYLKQLLTLGSLLLASGVAFSQNASINIDVNSRLGSVPPIWVNLSGFTGEALQVLQLDLYVQGFNFTNSAGAQYLLTGSNNGNLQGQATDRYNKQVIVSKAYSGASLRRQAHAFVDDFVQALGGTGICKTKIAFRADSGRSSD